MAAQGQRPVGRGKRPPGQLNRPTIANMRTLDLVHLLAAGGMLGAGMVGLIVYLVSRRAG